MADTAPAIDPARLQMRLDRAKAKIKLLEQLTEEKTRTLYMAQEELKTKNDFMTSLLGSMRSAVIVTDDDGEITEVHGATESMTDLTADDLVSRNALDLLTFENDVVPAEPAELVGPTQHAQITTADGPMPVLVTVSPLSHVGLASYVVLATDMSEQRRLEIELRHAQKLESVGQLAAGVAHEINTPIQFIGDSINFIGEAVVDSLEMIGAYRELRDQIASENTHAETIEKLEELEEELDIEFVEEEAPRSIERTRDGIRRVAEIVAAMKQFSHPGGSDLAPTDLNAIIANTLVVAKNEYKYVAEVTNEPGAIPEVMANPGDIGQVMLNLIVNAAHAITDRVGNSGELGHITITTAVDGDGVATTITDTGGGVPQDIRDRIFDPFFTTKEPGKGTGQGLAIARSMVVERHGGRLDLEVEDGVGSTFTIWLPGT